MPKRFLGNIMTDTPTAPAGKLISSAASGVWSLDEALSYTKVGLWPNAANPVPRALFAGGRETAGNFPKNQNVIEYVTITTTGNATDFGDLASLTQEHGAFSSSSRAVFFGGKSLASGTGQGSLTNVIQYVTISSTGDAADFGDLTGAVKTPAGVSSNTRGVRVGGHDPNIGPINVMDYVAIATTGNATDFGDWGSDIYDAYSCNSSTRGIVSGGAGGSALLDAIQYITIASTGNATDFGDLGSAIYNASTGIVSSATRGIVALGGREANSNYVNTIEYVTIATTGNSTDFGDLTVNVREGASASSTVRGLQAGGIDSGTNAVNSIQYITIASVGDSTDFGDLTLARYRFAGASNSHGGIAA